MISYIGLGSNLSEPHLQLKMALVALQNEPDIQLLKVSSFYQSKALTLSDAESQNDYINAVAQLETELAADQLLFIINKIEASQGRKREKKWTARTLDLDILTYGNCRIQTEKLVIPHLQIEFRNFVIHPLFEVAGAIDIPGLGNLAELEKVMNWNGLRKID
jgi:2-amino-4-hydroxy-6-hydroxymethyldihydropteridine diphosphokinase